MTLENKALVIACIYAALTFCTLSPTENAQAKKITNKQVEPKNNSGKDKQKASKDAPENNLKEAKPESLKNTDATKKPTPKKDEDKNKPKYPKNIDLEKRFGLHEEKRTVKTIDVEGNKAITKEAILLTVPVKVGGTLNVNDTSTIIKNIYKMGYFHQIKVYANPVGENEVDLLILVEEKPKLKDISFVGNKNINEKDLKEALQSDKIISICDQELKPLIIKIKKAYLPNSFHTVDVTAETTQNDDHTVSVKFTIQEGKKSYLTRISFKGNKQISSKKLKRIIISQEDWLLAFINHAGVYNTEMLEGDKYMIEDIYRNNGFVNAKVTDIEVKKDDFDNHHLIFHIQEGKRYRIKDINIEGNEVVSTERLRTIIPIYPGQIYSSENLRKAIENIRIVFGEHGYIFADIEPNMSVDETDRTVSIQFNTDTKDQVYLNRLTVIGNKKTHDKVIRRQILLEEGELITNQKMEVTKACVGLLGYFEPKTGVNWKTTRIDNTHADLDLVVKEVKTGHFNTNISFGGTPGKAQTPATGLSANVSFGDRNFLGSGIALSTSTDISQRYKSFQGSITNPWMFDKPIRGSLTGYVKSAEYDDQITIAENPPTEKAVGGVLGFGYVANLLGSVMIDGKLQVENITYTSDIKAAQRLKEGDRFIAQVLLNKYFQEGAQISLIANIGQDKRNGIVFPTNGHQWNWFAQWSFPGWQRSISEIRNETCPPKTNIANSFPSFNYIKSELDISWYTPLIGDHDLVLCLHGNMGIVHPFRGKDVPWKNLYHVGGPQTIRGYLWGQVGPMWKDDSLGATKSLVMNVEFIFPISADLGTRGVIFYDGGAGWDTPYLCDFIEKGRAVGISFEKDLTNNNFFYRHSVGIGVRMKSPSPIQVDFGIKLNPSKKFRRHLTELHFSMDQSF
jgi:outer membrane protein insertion porin family